MSDTKRDVKIRLAGLWQNKDRNGDLYLSGAIGQARLLVLRNTFKQPGEKTPDFNLYVVPREGARPLRPRSRTPTRRSSRCLRP